MITHLAELPLELFLAAWVFLAIIVYISGYIYTWRRLAWRLAAFHAERTTNLKTASVIFGVAIGGLGAFLWPWFLAMMLMGRVGHAIHGTGYEFLRPPREVRKRLRQEARDELQQQLETRERDLEAWHVSHPSGLTIAAARIENKDTSQELVPAQPPPRPGLKVVQSIGPDGNVMFTIDDLELFEIEAIIYQHNTEPSHCAHVYRTAEAQKTRDQWVARSVMLNRYIAALLRAEHKHRAWKEQEQVQAARFVYEKQHLADLERFQT